ncbi:MAG TPA: chemotaxis protein CheW [Rhodanobacteraceae bacterium]|nr:chemotaxis protein CheW [Rhodanobacteraceae bacterium]
MTKKRARKSAHGSRPQSRNARTAVEERVRDDVAAVAEQDEMIEEALTVSEQAPESVAPRRAPQRALLTSFEALIDYERRSLSHVAGVPEQIEAPGLWRGIGFRIGERVFVSSIHEVNEILGMPSAVTPVPATRNWLLGVANVRGNLIALVDLKQFLTEQRTHVSDRTRVLWVKQQGGGVGLLVDEVLGQRNLTDEQRVDAEGESDERLGRFVTENVTLGNTRVGMFSMVELTRAPDFQQTAV